MIMITPELNVYYSRTHFCPILILLPAPYELILGIKRSLIILIGWLTPTQGASMSANGSQVDLILPSILKHLPLLF